MIPQRLIPSSLFLMNLHIFRKFCFCQRPAFALCDWKDQTHKSGTCDQPVCSRHAKEVLPGEFLCPRHWLRYEHQRRGRQYSELEQRALFSEAA
jgi:hypothetical protein